jgi:hypothetical protein
MLRLQRLRKFPKDTALKEYNLIVIGVSKHGEFINSRPCYHCLKRLGASGLNIKYVYYSVQNGSILREKFIYMIDSPLTYVSSGFKIKEWRHK